MYRHFAVVTVLLTATLAIFASGENDRAEKELRAAEIQQRKSAATNKEEKVPTLALSKEAKRNTQGRSQSSSSHSISAGYGVPMDQVGAAVQDMSGADWLPVDTQGAIKTEAIPPGISPNVWATLSPEQKEEARLIFGEGETLSPEEQLRLQKEMIAASAIRARR